MSLHIEVKFENNICMYLVKQGWLHDEGDAAHYDRQNALYLPDLLAWIETTQPDSWQRMVKNHGASLQTVLAERVRKDLNDRGTLEVLRRGVEMLGQRHPLDTVHFKLALASNPVRHARCSTKKKVFA